LGASAAPPPPPRRGARAATHQHGLVDGDDAAVLELQLHVRRVRVRKQQHLPPREVAARPVDAGHLERRRNFFV